MTEPEDLGGGNYRLTLQPDGTDGIDTYTQNTAADTEHGSDTVLKGWSGIGGHKCTILIFYDLSAIPSSATITSGTHTLYHNPGESYGAVTYGVYRVLSANSGWGESSTWNYKVPSTQRWAGDAGGDGGTDAGCRVSGTDHSATAMGTFAADSSDPLGTAYNANLDTTELATLIATNYGIAVRSTADGNVGNVFCSSDHATAAYRPKLVVEYTVESSGIVPIILAQHRMRRN